MRFRDKRQEISDKKTCSPKPRFRAGLLLSIVFLLVPCHLSLVASAEAARIEYHEGLPVVFLSGTPYELGYQHGTLLRNKVRSAVQCVLGYFRQYLKIPLVSPWVVNWWLDTSWKSATPFIPPDALEELRGLSEGSGVALQELYRLHAIPDRTYSCSSFAAWGEATTGGRLIHMRNLDWSTQAGIQDFPVVFVVHPDGKQAFVNVGWAGFIGVLTGINEQELSIGQIGAKTLDTTPRGEPMVFLMRQVLEEAQGLEAASAIIVNGRRTIGTNYVLADAKARRAVVVETTSRHARIFEANDPAERIVRYARPMADIVFRADTAVDPSIRNQQFASGGNPTRPGLEDPTGSAYEVRYLGQAAGLAAHYGALNSETARQIAQAVAPASNIQSVVVAWPYLWVANAQGRRPAAKSTYHFFNIEQLLQSPS